jgi:hypothetical protein
MDHPSTCVTRPPPISLSSNCAQNTILKGVPFGAPKTKVLKAFWDPLGGFGSALGMFGLLFY